MFFNCDMYKIYFTNPLIMELIEKQIMIWIKYSILSIFLQGNSSRKKKIHGYLILYLIWTLSLE